MQTSPPEQPLLAVRDLSIAFCSRLNVTRAVDNISFDLQPGEALAIVGESGSGKSVTAKALTQLLPPPPGCCVSGQVLYQGHNTLAMSGKQLQQLRGKQIAYIFQEPASALNPAFTIGFQIAEAVKLHMPDVADVRAYVVQSMQAVGIRDAEQRYNAYPHEMSGGMQQRILIAMALACEPRILVADEPTTALDVTIQKQIIDLLKTIRQRLDMAVILITHNFGIVQYFADKVLVMYRGSIVECGPTHAILQRPQHPYTRALIDCIPRINSEQRRLRVMNYPH